jgi:hypothetical protein
MRIIVGEISSEFAVTSSARLSTKNAWALYARRRWPQNGVKAAMGEWSLTEGEAKGLFAAQVSQPTIDKIIDHPRGGFALGLLVLEIRTQTALRAWVQSEQERSADAARQHAENAAALGAMARRLPAVLGLAAGGAGGPPRRRSGRRGA